MRNAARFMFDKQRKISPRWQREINFPAASQISARLSWQFISARNWRREIIGARFSSSCVSFCFRCCLRRNKKLLTTKWQQTLYILSSYRFIARQPTYFASFLRDARLLLRLADFCAGNNWMCHHTVLL